MQQTTHKTRSFRQRHTFAVFHTPADTWEQPERSKIKARATQQEGRTSTANPSSRSHESGRMPVQAHRQRQSSSHVVPHKERDIEVSVQLNRAYGPGHGVGQMIVAPLGNDRYEVLAAFLPCQVDRIVTWSAIDGFEFNWVTFYKAADENVETWEVSVNHISGTRYLVLGSDAPSRSMARLFGSLSFATPRLGNDVMDFARCPVYRVTECTHATSEEAAPYFETPAAPALPDIQQAPLYQLPSRLWPLIPEQYASVKPTYRAAAIVRKGPARRRRYNRVVTDTRPLYELVGKAGYEKAVAAREGLKAQSRFHTRMPY